MSLANKLFALTALVLFFTASSPAQAGSSTLEITSGGFASGATIPLKFTGDGADIAPSLSWSKVPSGAKSIALAVIDSDAPGGNWWHWILYNLPAQTSELKEGTAKIIQLQNKVRQGRNDFGRIGYNGPAPPAGKVHHYHFRVYALDAMLDNAVQDKKGFEKAIANHVLDQGEIIGTYVRK